MKPIPINIITGILAGLQQGLSYRKIQNLYGSSKSTIARISERLSQNGLSIQDALSMSDEELKAFFYVPQTSSQIEPDWSRVHKKLQQKSVTLILLYQDYAQRSDGLGEIYTYSSFCRRYNEWKQRNGITSIGGNVDNRPAEKLEIDFAGVLGELVK